MKFSGIVWITLTFCSPFFAGTKKGITALYPLWVNHKVAYINRSGRIIVSPQFSLGSEFCDGVAIVRLFDKEEEYGSWAILDMKGNLIIQPKYDYKIDAWCFGFREGLLGVKYKNRWGFINTSGKMVVEPRYERVTCFSNGLAAVYVNGKYGYINKLGEMVIQPSFTHAGPFKDGLAGVCSGEKYGFIDTLGTYTILPQFEYVEPFSEGLAAVTTGPPPHHRIGFINTQGEWVIAAKFTETGRYSEGLVAVSMPDQDANGSRRNPWGIIDTKGATVINPQFLEIREYSEGLAWAIPLNGSLIGYINHKGDWVIKPQFHSGSSFHNGIAMIGYGGCYQPKCFGYIKKDGHFLRKPKRKGPTKPRILIHPED